MKIKAVAPWYLAMSWMGRNGSAGTKPSNITTARRFTSNGGSGGLRWRSAVESIPDWHERLRAVVINRMDAFELFERLSFLSSASEVSYRRASLRPVVDDTSMAGTWPHARPRRE